MAATKTSTEDWIEELKGISVLELSERIKALEEEFGVSATAVTTSVYLWSARKYSTSSTVMRSRSWHSGRWSCAGCRGNALKKRPCLKGRAAKKPEN